MAPNNREHHPDETQRCRTERRPSIVTIECEDRDIAESVALGSLTVLERAPLSVVAADRMPRNMVAGTGCTRYARHIASARTVGLFGVDRPARVQPDAGWALAVDCDDSGLFQYDGDPSGGRSGREGFEVLV